VDVVAATAVVGACAVPAEAAVWVERHGAVGLCKPVDEVEPMTKGIDAFVQELQAEITEQVREQYSETVLDHWMHPRNFGPLDKADGHARVTGPCGDTMENFVKVQDDRIAQASFLTDGCMTTIVAASMMVQLATDKPVSQAMALTQADILTALGGLPADSEHCALLAANTLHGALEDHLDTSGAPWKRLYRSV